jgi:hypothetical protein
MTAQEPEVAVSQEQPVYVSYLLRLWSVSIDGDVAWRASLESALAGQRQPFADLDDLFDFLRRETGALSERVRVRSENVGDGAP